MNRINAVKPEDLPLLPKGLADLIFVIRGDGEVVQVGDRLREALHLPDGDWLGQKLENLVDPRQSAKVQKALSQLPGLTGNACRLTCSFRHRTGGYSTHECLVTPIEGSPFWTVVARNTSVESVEDQEAKSLSDLASQLASATHLQEACQTFSRISDELFQWDGFLISQHAENPLHPTLMFAGGLAEKSPGKGSTREDWLSLPALDRLFEKVRQSNGWMGTDPETGIAEDHPLNRAGSRMAVPIQGGGNLLGMAVVWNLLPHAYTHREIKTFQTMGTLFGEVFKRLASEEELRQNEAFFRSVCAASPTGVLFLDASGNCTYANGKWEELTGRSATAALGDGWLNAFHPEDQNHVSLEWHRWRGSIGTFTIRCRIQHPEGSILWVSLSMARLTTLDSAGQATGYVGTFTDITELKRKDEELKFARDIAESVAELKSQFLANISHEIRTPMNGITGVVGLLEGTHLDPTQIGYLDLLRESSDHLMGIINQILDFSKIETRKLRIHVEAFNLHHILGQCLKSLSPQASEKGLSLEYLIHPDTPNHLKGDPTRLTQILYNLLGNAIKFTERGSIRLEVAPAGTANQDPNTTASGRIVLGDCMLLFSVVDTGIGIRAEDHAKLFQAFSQLDSSSTRRHEGTGLGLAIARELVQLLGGEIGLESTYGEGARFWFTAAFHEMEGPPPGETNPLPPGLRARILGPENSRMIMSRAMLHELGVSLTFQEDPNVDWTLLILDEGDAPSSLTRQLGKENVLIVGERVRAHQARKAASEWSHSPPLFWPAFSEDLARAMTLQPDPVTEEVIAPKTPQPADNSPRVLIAEDNPVNQRIAMEFLHQAGYRTTCVENGQEALESIAETVPDLVLMDIQMPVMDGLTALRKLRASEHDTGRRIPVLIVTAKALHGEDNPFALDGADGCITKPIRKKLLMETLSRWIPLTSGATMAPPPLPVLEEARLLAEIDQDRELLREMMKAFESHTPGILRNVYEQLQDGNLSEVSRGLHALKGSLAQFHASRARQWTQRLEKLAESEQPDNLSAGLAQLEELLAQTSEALHALIEKS